MASRCGGVRADRWAAELDSLRYLIDNPQLWPEMGRAGRAFVEENFDMRKLNERLVRIYEDVIAGRPVAGAEAPPTSPGGPHPQREET